MQVIAYAELLEGRGVPPQCAPERYRSDYRTSYTVARASPIGMHGLFYDHLFGSWSWSCDAERQSFAFCGVERCFVLESQV